MKKYIIAGGVLIVLGIGFSNACIYKDCASVARIERGLCFASVSPNNQQFCLDQYNEAIDDCLDYCNACQPGQTQYGSDMCCDENIFLEINNVEHFGEICTQRYLSCNLIDGTPVTYVGVSYINCVPGSSGGGTGSSGGGTGNSGGGTGSSGGGTGNSGGGTGSSGGGTGSSGGGTGNSGGGTGSSGGGTGDGQGCCRSICVNPAVPEQTSGTCNSGWTGDGQGCCTKICIPPQCGLNPDGTCKTPGYIPDGQGCCDAPAGCTKPATGANLDDCSAYPGHIFSGGCCDPVPNQCTGSKAQYGVLSGQSYTCADCGSGKMADETHTKCVCDSSQGCCGIKLNTVVPFIGDCIEMDGGASSNNTTRVNALNAFPKLMGSLSKIMITVILIFSFVMIVIGGILITSGGINESNFKKGKEIIGKVIMGLALLGASGIILHLINPSFFK